jgi:hypothetical protein
VNGESRDHLMPATTIALYEGNGQKDVWFVIRATLSTIRRRQQAIWLGNFVKKRQY